MTRALQAVVDMAATFEGRVHTVHFPFSGGWLEISLGVTVVDHCRARNCQGHVEPGTAMLGGEGLHGLPHPGKGRSGSLESGG